MKRRAKIDKPDGTPCKTKPKPAVDPAPAE